MRRAAVVLSVSCAAGTAAGILIAYLTLGHLADHAVPL
jgi:hypothetical protein